MPELITFLTQNGLPEYVVVWMFMLLVAITITVISRQIIGIKGLGIIAPVLIGFAFSATGLQAGMIIFLFALGVGLIIHSLLKKVRLLYLPKMALLLSGVTIAVLFLTPLLPYGESLQFPQAIFSFIIFILLVEQFASLLIERGPRKTFNIALETLAVSVAIFFIITWSWLQDIIISYPLFVLVLVFIVNAILGKWTGLRFSEYIRFKNLIFK